MSNRSSASAPSRPPPSSRQSKAGSPQPRSAAFRLQKHRIALRPRRVSTLYPRITLLQPEGCAPPRRRVSDFTACHPAKPSYSDRMKALGLWLGFLAATLLPVSAQITVEVTQDQDQFLPCETLATAVRITNRSGQDVRLGQGDDWLTFSVQSHEELVVPRNGQVPVAGEFTLESSKVATKRVDLEPYFAINRPGRYSITATIRIKDWNQQITSQPKSFDIIEGAHLWEQEIGVPNADAPTNSTPEVRKYILQQANYLRSQLRLYVRLTDAC